MKDSLLNFKAFESLDRSDSVDFSVSRPVSDGERRSCNFVESGRILLVLILFSTICMFSVELNAQESGQGGSAAAQGDGVKQFQDRLDEWKKIIIELQILRQEYYLSRTREESEEFKQKYDATKKAGDEKIKELKLAAAQAYRDKPREGTDYYNLLINSLAFDQEATENQGLAYEIAKALNTRPINRPDIARRVGIAFFLHNEFDEAEKLMKFAVSSNVEGAEALQESLNMIPRLKPIWEKEKKRRAEDENKDLPRAIFETTKGTFVVELFEDNAPNTVKNFVKLAKQGFYDDLFFFQALPFKYILTGSPNSNASGSPGYALKNEALDREKRRGNFRGTLCVPARDENANVAGSIFMITLAPYSQANTDGYCNFGRVIKGMEVVDSLERSHDRSSQPIESFQPDKIIKVTLENLRDTEYEPEIIRIGQ